MAEYAIVIRGGKVVDGTGNPWTYADIGIRDGRIAAIGRIDASQGDRVIDAGGLIVAPGFIDMHTHSDTTLLADGDAQSKIRQGVTLDIIGESQSVAPLQGVVADEYRDAQFRRDAVEVDWADFTGYFQRVEQQGISMNVASCVAPQQVKRAVVGFEDRPATPRELEAMKSLIAEAMEQGVVGLSSAWHGGGYDHAEEVIEMARVAARYGGFFGTHVGSEGFQLNEEVEKAIRVGEETGLPVHIYHLKVRGLQLWGKVTEAIDMIEAARGRGLDVTANQYPYTAMQHPWRRLFPRWVQDVAVKEIVPRFRDGAFRERIKMDEEFNQYVDEHGGWQGIVASRVTNPALSAVEGKTVAQIAEMRGTAPADTCFDVILEEGDFPFGVYHNMSEEDIKTVMRQPWISIASDAGAINESAPGKPHPRAYGSAVRVLGKYVREECVLTLEDAVRKMTTLPAQVLGLRDRGALREGAWADIAIFDPETVIDKATFDLPQQYAEGVYYVLVNGDLVIDGGGHTGARPGAVVYGPGRAG